MEAQDIKPELDGKQKRLVLERQLLVKEAVARELARKREEDRKSAKERETEDRRQRLALEGKLQQLKLELEIERLRQQHALAQQKARAASIDTIPPEIRAETSLVTRTATVTIDGTVSDNVNVSRVELNGKRLETSEGRFSTNAAVQLGQNNMRLTAFDSRGNKTEHIVIVTRNRDIPDISYGNYYALVIGINKYSSLPKLNTAVSDAQTVAKTLEDLYGFKVMLLTDPTRADIIDAFDEFRNTLTEEDNLLIYYAGHGWLDRQTQEEARALWRF